MSRVILESSHCIHRDRPQFAGAKASLEDGRSVLRAPCGCVNYTAIVAGRLSCDGSTWLCDEHGPGVCPECDRYDDDCDCDCRD